MKQKSIFVSDNSKSKAESLNVILSEGFQVIDKFRFEETQYCFPGWLIILQKD